jgi:hypothetical protein
MALRREEERVLGIATNSSETKRFKLAADDVGSCGLSVRRIDRDTKRYIPCSAIPYTTAAR